MALKIEGGASTNKITDENGNVLFEFDATTGKLVAGQFLGTNQTWQEAELTDTGATFDDGTPSYRASGVTYTNNTGKPIGLSLRTSQNSSVNYTVGLSSLNGSNTTSSMGTFDTLIIPPDTTYSFTIVSGLVVNVYELR